MTRRFGPTQGAGTVVIERQGEQPITPGALGLAAYYGILERGPVGELIDVLTKPSLERKTGGRIADSFVPDSAIDFFDEAEGGGGLFLIRVTDGTELKSAITLRNRRTPWSDVVQVDANNGGRWAGKRDIRSSEVATIATDITETTIDTGWMPSSAISEDVYKGGKVRLFGVTGKTYDIIASGAAGPSTSLVLTVTSDSLMASDLAGGGDPTNKGFAFWLLNEAKEVTLLVKDGSLEPDTEWGLEVYVDDVLVRDYLNLSSDPNSARYFISIVNDDPENHYIVLTDLWTGAITADIRPANYASLSNTLTATRLTADIFQFAVTGTGDGTVGSLTLGSLAKPDKLTLTCTDDITPGSEVFSVVSQDVYLKVTDLPDATVGVVYTEKDDYGVGFTITAGATNFVVGDVIIIEVYPFEPDVLIGGILTPNTAKRRVRFNIVDNGQDFIDVATGNDMTVEASATDPFRVEFQDSLRRGTDGISGITDSDFTNLMQFEDTPLRELEGENFGLVKLAAPGNGAVAVEKAGAAIAEALNHQWRYEIPSNILSETDAEEYATETLGRNDFAVVTFPSWVYKTDPEGEGGLVLVPATGMIHGEEAKIARNFDGYHKAEAGIDAVLAKVIKLPTGTQPLNEEFLNPRGINVMRVREGNTILWGDRTLSVNPEWKWKHQRELMSYYEHILLENFDWIIFAIQNPDTQQQAKSSLISFFFPEYNKGALDNFKTFDEAAIIKIDDENNTAATRAAGDLHADIDLGLADTVERFIMTVSKQGIFERVVAP
jgi:hypothetical protein